MKDELLFEQQELTDDDIEQMYQAWLAEQELGDPEGDSLYW